MFPSFLESQFVTICQTESGNSEKSEKLHEYAVFCNLWSEIVQFLCVISFGVWNVIGSFLL